MTLTTCAPLPPPKVVYPFLSPQQDAPEEVSCLVAQAAFELELHCRGKEYTLGVKQGSEQKSYATCAAADLTTVPPAHGAAFAGVLFGVYSFGRGEPVLDAADFGDIRVHEYDEAGWSAVLEREE